MIIKNKNTKKIPLLAVILVLIIGAGAFFAYKYNQEDKSSLNDSDRKNSSKDDASKESPANTPQTPTTTLPESVNPSDVRSYNLVTENERYKIRELDGNYVITLYAIVNRPEQSDTYYDQLREYKYDALKYLEQHSVDPTKVKITYEPDNAKDL